MFESSALVIALKAAADSIVEDTRSTWTGATALRTITAEETGIDNDIELLYFQIKDRDGAIYWVDESGMDEMTDADMQEYLSI